MGFLESAKPRPTKSRSAFIEGFSCHADLHLHANDREGLERLLLYGGRGPIANERLALLPDGRVSYYMKRPAPDGRTHLVCSALDFMRKLAAIVPPPRVNLLRFHGVFGPSARLRPRVVPVPEKPAQPRPAKQKRFDFQADAGADAREEAPPRRSAYSWPELMSRTFRLRRSRMQPLPRPDAHRRLHHRRHARPNPPSAPRALRAVTSSQTSCRPASAAFRLRRLNRPAQRRLGARKRLGRNSRNSHDGRLPAPNGIRVRKLPILDREPLPTFSAQPTGFAFERLRLPALPAEPALIPP